MRLLDTYYLRLLAEDRLHDPGDGEGAEEEAPHAHRPLRLADLAAHGLDRRHLLKVWIWELQEPRSSHSAPITIHEVLLAVQRRRLGHRLLLLVRGLFITHLNPTDGGY